MPNETTAADEKKKKKEEKKSLEAQTEGMKPSPSPSPKPSPKPTPPGVTAQQAFDRTRQSVTEEGKRAAAEQAVAEAEVRERVQPTVDTPERRAEAWVKANGKVLGIGNRAAYFKKIKEGLSPADAWKAVGGK